MPRMEFYWDEIDDDVLILAADGGLNASSADEFMGSIETLVDAGLRRIIIDCSRLNYISSYGLGVLIRLHGRLREHGGDVKIAAVRGIIPQALHATKLDTLFDIHPDVNRARLAFRPKSDLQ
jgi:anti-sigma B factor antagonist